MVSRADLEIRIDRLAVLLIAHPDETDADCILRALDAATEMEEIRQVIQQAVVRCSVEVNDN